MHFQGGVNRRTINYKEVQLRKSSGAQRPVLGMYSQNVQCISDNLSRELWLSTIDVLIVDI